LSKSMEAFISSMIAAGLEAKRPPHMVLVIAVAPRQDEVSGKT
jgi:hypothetical protein